jgi:hypothetical protein
VGAARAQPSGQDPKTGSVGDARSVELMDPGVSRLVPERLIALRKRKMRGDSDPVRPAIPDLAAGELAGGEADDGRSKAEPRRQAVVEPLQLFFGIGRGQREEEIQGK